VKSTARDCRDEDAGEDFAMISVAFFEETRMCHQRKVDEAAEHLKDFADESCSTELAGPNAKLNERNYQGEHFMRRYHFWLLALGLMAMTPAVTEAGWFSKKSDKPTASSKAVKSNQQVAEQIGKALRTQDLKGHDISVEYKGGVARLTGHAPSLRHKAAITKVVTEVSDVKRVDNRLRISAPRRCS
jgi:hypothetical protein